MKISRFHLVNLAMITVLLVIAGLGHLFSPLLLPKTEAKGEVTPGCNLQQGSCSASLPQGGRMEFSITPRPIQFLQPLRIEASFSGVAPLGVEVDFAGETMNMGYNRSRLAAAGAGRHVGEASLPVCVTGGMVWIATVIVETDRQRIAVPFRIVVGP